VRTPHIEAHEYLQLKPGTNVALLNALAHVVVTEGFVKEAYVAAALRAGVVCQVEGVRRPRAQLPGGLGSHHRGARGARAPRGAPVRDRRQ